MGQIDSRTRADVIRRCYDAIRNGDLPGLLDCLNPEIIMNRPTALAWSGERRGRDYCVNSVLSQVMSLVTIDVAESHIYECDTNIVGSWSGQLIARNSSEKMDVKVVEIFSVEDDLVTHIDVYYKDPVAVAEFYRHNGVG